MNVIDEVRLFFGELHGSHLLISIRLLLLEVGETWLRFLQDFV